MHCILFIQGSKNYEKTKNILHNFFAFVTNICQIQARSIVQAIAVLANS